MQNVITLIANPAKNRLDERAINKAIIAAERAGAYIETITWLAEAEAADIFFSKAEISGVKEKVAAKLAEVTVDFAVQPVEGRKKKLLISDMDSTIIEQECIDELAGMLGLKEKVSAITERAMNGELDFAEALTERVALLKGLKEAQLQEVYEKRITLMPGAKELVATMRKNGARCLLVSGGFTFFTGKVAEATGFQEHHANRLEIKDWALTGKVIAPILGKEAKLAQLKQAVKTLGIAMEETLAVGDGANDLPMLLAAGTGVAYHAKPSVREQVAVQVNHNGLTALLYLQGYTKSEFCHERKGNTSL